MKTHHTKSMVPHQDTHIELQRKVFEIRCKPKF